MLLLLKHKQYSSNFKLSSKRILTKNLNLDFLWVGGSIFLFTFPFFCNLFILLLFFFNLIFSFTHIFSFILIYSFIYAFIYLFINFLFFFIYVLYFFSYNFLFCNYYYYFLFFYLGGGGTNQNSIPDWQMR